ncbi:MAG: hypothetical protein ACI9MC_003368 [Kiritimatiellia bacterium]
MPHLFRDSITNLQKIRIVVRASAALLLGLPTAAMAADGHRIEGTVGTLWILIATALVFIVHLGFASLEAGFPQPKITIITLFKNISFVAMGLRTYAFTWFNLVYPVAEYAGGFFSFAGIGTDADGVTSAYNEHDTCWVDFIFQAMLAATAVTIVSAAVAERGRIQLACSSWWPSSWWPHKLGDRVEEALR